MIWTSEAVDRLIKLWPDHSASQIAVEFGEGVTRNSVIGKAHREGLMTKRPEIEARKPCVWVPRKERRADRPLAVHDDQLARRLASRLAAQAREERFKIENDRKTAFDGTGKVSFLGLRSIHCRWPYGDPRTPELRFCGDPCARKNKNVFRPYCEHHVALAYQPSNRP